MGQQSFVSFKNDIDFWVKDLNSKVVQVQNLPRIVEEHADNINHNYELIQDLKDEMKALREEISALRMIQVLHLRSEVQKKV
ncbi:MAG: hypothetical protein Q7S65_03015 [Nanoarchaeota archaeon]|nr:hypothetical protein [Nanoarchaeota archaeon]